MTVSQIQKCILWNEDIVKEINEKLKQCNVGKIVMQKKWPGESDKILIKDLPETEIEKVLREEKEGKEKKAEMKKVVRKEKEAKKAKQ